MANRSYLYVVDRLPQEGLPVPHVRGVHQYNTEVPLLHTLLVSGNAVECPSLIWAADTGSDWPAARCIAGDARLGVEKLEQAFASLPNTPQTREKITRARTELAAALKYGSYFVLEHAEITHEFAADAAEAQLSSDMEYSSAQHANLNYVQQNAESLIDEITGAGGFWNEHLYFAPVSTAIEPAKAEEEPTTPVLENAVEQPRSYLYVVDRIPALGQPLPRVRGVHENPYYVPIMHLLAVSGNTVECPSLVWRTGLGKFEDGNEWPLPRALVGEARLGIENLERAFTRLPDTQANRVAVAQAREALVEALQYGSWFVLEYAEISYEEAEEPWNVQRESEFMLSEAQGADELIEKVPDLDVHTTVGDQGRWSHRLHYAPISYELDAAAHSLTTPSLQESERAGGSSYGEALNPPKQKKTKKRLPRGARISLIVGAVVLLTPVLLFGILSAVLSSDGSNTAVSSEAAVEAAESYLHALAAGDADRARELVGGDPEAPLLSKTALDRSNQLAPITNISVEVSGTDERKSDGSKQVIATFNVGDVHVTKELTVSGTGNRVRRIADATVTWDASDRRLADLGGLVVNGVEISDPGYLTAFPGAYEFALGNKFYEIVGETQVIIANSKEEAAVEDMDFELTQTAIDDFRALVAASLDECLASKEANSSCGIDLPSTFKGGETVVDGTVTRTLTTEGRETLETLIPEPDLTKPLMLTATGRFATKITATFTRDGATVEGEVNWGLTGSSDVMNWDTTSAKKPSVDFGTENPTVVWR